MTSDFVALGSSTLRQANYWCFLGHHDNQEVVLIHSLQKFADTRYTSTVAFLLLAMIFSPAVLILTRPFGELSVTMAAVFSASCIALACVAWSKDSKRQLLSVVTQPTR